MYRLEWLQLIRDKWPPFRFIIFCSIDGQRFLIWLVGVMAQSDRSLAPTAGARKRAVDVTGQAVAGRAVAR